MSQLKVTDWIANLSPAKLEMLQVKLREKQDASRPVKAIPRRASQELAPLSFAQQRLWFLSRLEPESAAYNQSQVVRLEGALDIDALKRAFHQIVVRHAVLRTTIVSVDGTPMQRIAKGVDFELPLIDLQSIEKGRVDSEARRLLATEAQRPFDLSQDLMLRGLLLRLTEREHILSVVKHHIASDAYSSSILWRELDALYRAFATGQENRLAELPIQYADYAVWQREWLQGEALERQLSYWRKQLGGISTLSLPTDRSRPAFQSHRGAVEEFALGEELSEGLKALSREEGATVFMTLLAAFQTLLYRYSGQDDVAVGSPIANRNRTEIEGLIGFFANTLVLRGDLSGNPTFRELLQRVREIALEAYEHQDLPFEKLVEELNPERSLGHSPLFQVMFVLQNAPSTSPELQSLNATPMSLNSDTAKFDLTLAMYEGADGMSGAIEYSSDLFEDATIVRMGEHYRTLLEAIVANPDKQLLDLPLLTAAEEHRLLVEWNDTQVDYPREKCLHESFEAQADRTPDAVAVVFGEKRLTYRELDRQANQVARYLMKLGVGPDTLVGMRVERSLEMVVVLLGILKAGGAYLPMNPANPLERLEFVLRDAKVKILLTESKFMRDFSEVEAPSVAGVEPPLVVCLDLERESIAQESQAQPIHQATPDNVAYVIYTSGSTGNPKGVMNTHRGVCNRISWGQTFYPLSGDDSVLHACALSFDFATWEIFTALAGGARLVLAEPEIHHDSAYLVRLMAANRITVAGFVPSMLEAILKEPGITMCHSLRKVFAGGEVLSLSLQDRFHACLNAELENTYGPTEAAIDVTYWTCRREAGDSRRRSVPIGRSIANTQIYVLDHHLQPVPLGAPGELH
ncbi:MAG: condensation domain-containing protein, partial [Candidatus Binatia bacterium]